MAARESKLAMYLLATYWPDPHQHFYAHIKITLLPRRGILK